LRVVDVGNAFDASSDHREAVPRCFEVAQYLGRSPIECYGILLGVALFRCAGLVHQTAKLVTKTLSVVDLTAFRMFFLSAKVHGKLTKNAVDRAMRLKGSPALLMGRIFDDVGNRMTPSHSNKRCVRCRYYASHALIQGRRHQSSAVNRVPATEIEDLVLEAVRLSMPNRKSAKRPLGSECYRCAGRQNHREAGGHRD